MKTLAMAEYERDEAIGRVENNANEAWKVFMLDLVRQHATTNERFTADKVYDRYETIPGAPTTHEPRAFGAVIRRAVTAGYIKKTGRFLPSTRSHCTPRQEWESCIFIGANDNTAARKVELAA